MGHHPRHVFHKRGVQHHPCERCGRVNTADFSSREHQSFFKAFPNAVVCHCNHGVADVVDLAVVLRVSRHGIDQDSIGDHPDSMENQLRTQIDQEMR